MVNKSQQNVLNYIEVNDIFDELSHENQRLSKELIFANKCLKVFDDLKTHLNQIHSNYDNFISSEDKQAFKELIQRCDSLVNLGQNDYRLVPDSSAEEVIPRLPLNVNKQSSSTTENNSIDCNFESLDWIRDYQKYIPSYEERERYFNPKTNEYECPKCDDISPSSTSFLLHFYRYHRKPDLCCVNPYCNRLFLHKSTLKKHGHSFGKKVLHCSQEKCSFQTKDGLLLRLHLMSHSTISLFKCDINDCKHSYRTLAGLTQHLRLHERPAQIIETEEVLNDKYYDRCLRLFKCPISDCPKTFHNRRNLSVHLKRHEAFKYKCTMCSRTFRTGLSCDSHIKRHLNVRPFACTHENCEFRTTEQKYLKNHFLNVHSAENQFKCDFIGCGQTFRAQTSLNLHKKIHLSEPTIKCRFPSCEQRFYKYSDVVTHQVAVHNKKRGRTKRQAIPCDWPGCEYVAKQKSTLVLHRQLHTGEKNYVCEFNNCGKSFRLRSGYMEHRNTHYNLKPFKCTWPGCQYGSAFSANVVKHVKQVHKRITKSFSTTAQNNGQKIA